MNAVHIGDNFLQILANTGTGGEILSKQRRTHSESPRVDTVDEINPFTAVDAAGDDYRSRNCLAVWRKASRSIP